MGGKKTRRCEVRLHNHVYRQDLTRILQDGRRTHSVQCFKHETLNQERCPASVPVIAPSCSCSCRLRGNRVFGWEDNKQKKTIVLLIEDRPAAQTKLMSTLLRYKRSIKFERWGELFSQAEKWETKQGVPSVGHQCVTQIPAEECTCNYSTVQAHSEIPGYHYSTVTTMPRARSLPCLLNSIWKHNERMTELTTLTSKLLHQCFHPLAFSFSTHHFPLLCNWETVTTSESWGWSYMKGAEGFEPTLMWLAPSLHALWFLLTVTPAIFFFLFSSK